MRNSGKLSPEVNLKLCIPKSLSLGAGALAALAGAAARKQEINQAPVGSSFIFRPYPNFSLRRDYVNGRGNEESLVGEAGTRGVFLGRFRPRRQDRLDRGAKFSRAQKSPRHAPGGRRSFLSQRE